MGPVRELLCQVRGRIRVLEVVSGGDQPPGSARSRERGRDRSEQAPVGVGALGSVDLAAQHAELVAQHDDLEVLRAA